MSGHAHFRRTTASRTEPEHRAAFKDCRTKFKRSWPRSLQLRSGSKNTDSFLLLLVCEEKIGGDAPFTRSVHVQHICYKTQYVCSIHVNTVNMIKTWARACLTVFFLVVSLCSDDADWVFFLC